MRWLWIILGSVVGVIALIAIVAAITGAMLPVGHVASRRARFRQTPSAIWAAISRDGQKTFREDDVNYEVLEAVPDRRLVTRIADKNLPYGGTWTYEIEADGTGPGAAGSTLHVTEHGEVYNPIFRFVSRFVMGHTATIDSSLRALGKKFGEDVRIEDAPSADQPAAR
jgi:hypothetical protein